MYGVPIDFPADEIDSLRGLSEIITHRVSDDFAKFRLGDVVIAPWGDSFKVTGRVVLNRIGDSPYFHMLSASQRDFLGKYGKIAVLTLKKVNVEFNEIQPGSVLQILASAQAYSDNKRLDVSKFIGEYFDVKRFSCVKLWYGEFLEGKCLALSVLKKTPGDFVLLAVFQSFVKGAGKMLLDNILSRCKNIWWCADPHGGEPLADYYRRFGLEEHRIEMSKWTNTPEYAFFKASDAAHRQLILDTLEKAEANTEVAD